ncbi:DNA integrity scanning protein DisA nucleotide-binding domain protein, partial [candidate division WOR-3 bacterium]|nr:DNA integrity scanning protein DisA nucleotide-binding domain protein [candidate division WOR-3 bacterium]
FNPKSPLHDGAVIVKGDTIIASSCILPLSDRTLDSGVGTRHRAALGLAEETDAVSMVISEETGNISLAVDRMLMRNLSKERLEKELKEKLG